MKRNMIGESEKENERQRERERERENVRDEYDRRE